MNPDDLDRLIHDLKQAVVDNPSGRIAIVGHTVTAYDIASRCECNGLSERILGIYSTSNVGANVFPLLKPLNSLATNPPEIVVIAADAEKELYLEAAAPFLRRTTRVVIAGYGHFAFRDRVFDELVRDSLVPSLANGYPNTLTHLYQCIRNSARLNLEGVVAEFGMFKGGTTMLLSRFIKACGKSWPVIGFDTFSGFPPHRSVYDMYDHPGCVFSNENAVRQYVAGNNIEVVAGDIVTTATRLANENIVLAFVDTDNYTSANAVLDVVQDKVLAGGAIVFDHFAGRNRFVYTLGERIAAKRLLSDSRYFNLHDTGVFIKQK